MFGDALIPLLFVHGFGLSRLASVVAVLVFSTLMLMPLIFVQRSNATRLEVLSLATSSMFWNSSPRLAKGLRYCMDDYFVASRWRRVHDRWVCSFVKILWVSFLFISFSSRILL